MRDRYTYHFTAVCERPLPNAGETVAYRHDLQTTASCEGRLLNTGMHLLKLFPSRFIQILEALPTFQYFFSVHVGDYNVRQTTAVFEDPFANDDAVGNRYASQTSAVIESTPTNTRDAVGNRNIIKTIATFKSTFSNAGDIVGDRYARKATASFESASPNAGNTLAYRYVSQTTAATESILWNADNSVCNRYFP